MKYKILFIFIFGSNTKFALTITKNGQNAVNYLLGSWEGNLYFEIKNLVKLFWSQNGT